MSESELVEKEELEAKRSNKVNSLERDRRRLALMGYVIEHIDDVLNNCRKQDVSRAWIQEYTDYLCTAMELEAVLHRSAEGIAEQISMVDVCIGEIEQATEETALERKKSASHAMVASAVKHGMLVRSTTCSECGDPHDRIQGHHEDYDKPLDVVWLCPSCHGKRHAEINSKNDG